LKTTGDGADVTWGGRSFHVLAPETGKARLPDICYCMTISVNSACFLIRWCTCTYEGVVSWCRDTTSIDREFGITWDLTKAQPVSREVPLPFSCSQQSD